MKRQLLNKILVVLFLIPVHLFGQAVSFDQLDITGLWKGSLYNDTTEKYLPYEIAISDEKGKLTGYSYILFDIDGKKELGIKKIKISKLVNQVVIEDVELISNTYSAPPPRRVKMRSESNLTINDSLMQLTGKWSTNQTREYRPLTGRLQLERSMDYHPLVLFKKLVELKLDQQLSFVKAEKKLQPDIAINEKTTTPAKPAAALILQPGDADEPPVITTAVPDKKQEVAVENKSTVKEIIPVLIPAEKPVADKQKDIVAAVPGKNTEATVVPGDTIKNLQEPLLQPVVDEPAIKKHTALIIPVIKKAREYIVKQSVVVKRKPMYDQVKPPVVIAQTIIPVPAIKKEEIVAVNEAKKTNIPPVATKPATITPAPVTKRSEPVAIVKEPAKKEKIPDPVAVQKPAAIEKPKTIIPPAQNKTAPVASVKEPVTESKPPAITLPAPKKEALVVKAAPVVTAAANVAERKMKNEQSVYFESDSLVLTLYDNGEVDGDTVSVLMNGEIIFARQGLSTKANSKTIYVNKGITDSLSMVMYAENLGSIPPNTGLLIIMDGEKRYEVRFSADLKTNAAILLRRRIKEN